MKDPMKPVIRIYEVEWDTFAEEEGDGEEDEDDEGPEVDEDGNVVPPRPE
jgi:hypothetical protein